MKKIILLGFFIFSSHLYAQRTLVWKVGDPQVTCGETIQICYPLEVSIRNSSQSPSLGTSTIRFFYDANYLTNLTVNNIENGYTQSGFNQSAPVFGDVFGFSSVEGVFAQFNLIDNAAINPIYLNGSGVHVLDLCFEVTLNGENDWSYYGSLTAPIVLDNNTNVNNYSDVDRSIDTGFLNNDAGIVGTYFLSNQIEEIYLANDEVRHYQWRNNNSHRGKIKKLKDNVGKSKTNGISNYCGLNREAAEPILKEVNSFIAYPVPFDNEINVSYLFDYNTDVVIEIYDGKGMILWENKSRNYSPGTSFKQNIDLSKIDQQILYVRVKTNKEVLVKKIVPITKQ